MPQLAQLLTRAQHAVRSQGVGTLILMAGRLAVAARVPFFKKSLHRFAGLTGLEIGGPTAHFRPRGLFPVYSVAGRVDNCIFSDQTVWAGKLQEGQTFRYDPRRPPGMQYVVDGTRISKITEPRYDFLLASHVIEHIANPLKALAEWTRVLKPGGTMLVIVPHKDGTFDHRRPVTPLEHIAEDFERDTPEADLTHLDEIMRLHDFWRDPGAGTREQFAQRSRENLQNRCLHQHVFDSRSAVQLVDRAGLQIREVSALKPYDIFILAEKLAPGATVDNRAFLGERPAYISASPFRSDR